MNRKELLENLEDLAKQAGEHQDSLELAACLKVLVMGRKKTRHLFAKVYAGILSSELFR